MPLESWSEVLATSFQEVWIEIARSVPRFVVATIIFIIGWLVGSVLGGVVSHALRSLRFDKALQSLGVDELVAHAGFKLDSGKFLGGLVKWFFIIVFLLTSVNILGLGEVSTFLRDGVLGYLPNVIVASLILLIGAVAAEAVSNFVMASSRAAGFKSAGLLGGVSKWAILIFAVLPALDQLGIGGAFAQTLFAGIVYMLAIAGGIAFGLGGKEAASDFIARIRGDISSKK